MWKMTDSSYNCRAAWLWEVWAEQECFATLLQTDGEMYKGGESYTVTLMPMWENIIKQHY